MKLTGKLRPAHFVLFAITVAVIAYLAVRLASDPTCGQWNAQRRAAVAQYLASGARADSDAVVALNGTRPAGCVAE